MTTVTKAGVIADNSIVVPPYGGPLRLKPPPEPTPYDDYIENEVSMRAAKELPRLMLQQQQRNCTDGSGIFGTAKSTPLSGAGRARSEIFERRAQLAAEMSKLGMPPMVNWGDAGEPESARACSETGSACAM